MDWVHKGFPPGGDVEGFIKEQGPSDVLGIRGAISHGDFVHVWVRQDKDPNVEYRILELQWTDDVAKVITHFLSHDNGGCILLGFKEHPLNSIQIIVDKSLISEFKEMLSNLPE